MGMRRKGSVSTIVRGRGRAEVLFAALLVASSQLALVALVDCERIITSTSASGEKTADLSRLINETLALNNRTQQQNIQSTHQSQQQQQQQQPSNPQQPNVGQKPRDDWTFERVEYDLLEFLEDLSARYKSNEQHSKQQQAAKDESPVPVPSSVPVAQTRLAAKSDAQASSSSSAPSQASSSSSPSSKPSEAPLLPQLATSQLPVSLAPEDHDISESKWQYGIFDRFTRARSTTPQPHLVHGGAPSTAEPSGAGLGMMDVRSFNSDECGLRTYAPEGDSSAEPVPSFFPQPADLLPLSGGGGGSADDGAAGEASKELNQRRQRPGLLATIASRRKQQPQPQPQEQQPQQQQQQQQQQFQPEELPAGDQDERLAPGAPEEATDQAAGEQADGAASAADSEFNLNSRRQWLQQQLGNTLQMLGFNVSHQSPAEFLNQTSGLSLSTRENMMKKSVHLPPFAAAKVAKSLGSEQQSREPKRPQTQSPPKQQQQHRDNLADQALVRQLDELRARQDELKLEARVIGGTDARLGDSPWSVSLQALVSRPGTAGVEYRHYCGGTIISEYYILTAAHCLDFMVGRESRLFVVMGDLNWRMSTASTYGRRVGIERLIIHSGYKSTAFGHDIGLIRTREPIRPVRANGRYIINSVCLPERNVEHSGEAELVGWGLFSNRNEMADSLQVADVPILPRPLCVDLYRRRTGLIQWLIGVELITDKQICAGTFGRGICQGDSGSALVFNEKVPRHYSADGAADQAPAPASAADQTAPDGRAATTGRHRQTVARDQLTRATQIGVVAFGGIRRCSYQSLPGVYMQTSKYLDWILPKISA